MKGISFVGNLGGAGPDYPAICQNCGNNFFTKLPFQSASKNRRINFENVSVSCPNCGEAARIIDGTYDFFIKTYETLKDANLTKKQLQRFERKVKKNKDPASLEVSASAINPVLGRAVAAASKEANPKGAIQVVTKLAWIIGMAGGGFLGAMEGVVTADELYDRWRDGELFESRPLNAQEAREEPTKKTDPKTADPKKGDPFQRKQGR